MSTDGSFKTLAKYAPYRRVGDLVYMSGVTPVEHRTGLVIRDFADIPEQAAELIGRTGELSVDAKQGKILAQSWHVLHTIEETVTELGGSMDNVVKLVQYFRKLHTYPYYNRVRSLFFKNYLPVSTIVEVSDMLPSKEVLVEVEATLWLPQ